jgi:hypothetical protein
MNGSLEKLRRGAIRALGGYVEQVPPPKPQDRVLIKSESRRIEKITAKSRICYKGLDGDRARQWAMRHTKEDFVKFLMRKMLESGAIRIKERPAAGKFGGSELRATVYVAFPRDDRGDET